MYRPFDRAPPLTIIVLRGDVAALRLITAETLRLKVPFCLLTPQLKLVELNVMQLKLPERI